MDIFKKSSTVKLRSHHGKYLFADEDECDVSQSRDGSKSNAVWTVEFEDDKPSVIKLKSCYNCYLTATNVHFLLGWTGKKVLQMKLVDSESTILWEPVMDGFSVKLRTRVDSYLRANGSIPPWRNSITHDSASKHEWLLWKIVPVGDGHANENVLSQKPSLTSSTAPSFASSTSLLSSASFISNPSFTHQSSISSNYSFKEHSPISRPKGDGRIIHYVIADDDIEIPIPDDFYSEFLFKGDDVEMLTEKLKEETGTDDDLYVYGKNRVTNQLFPLHLQLPPTSAPMYLVLVKASSKLAETLQGEGAETEHGDPYSRSSSFD